MPDLIWFEYQLFVDDKQERTGDEPRFEFYFVNIFNNVARATVVDTGVLEVNMRSISSPSTDSSIGRQRLHPPLAPSTDNPFLAMAVRAFEHDDTPASSRYNLQDTVLQRIEEMYNPLLRAGRRPSLGDLWTVVNNAPLPSEGDADERIGVSVREYPTFGRDLIRDGTRRNLTLAGRTDDAFAFSQSSARWRMPFYFAHQFLPE